MLDDVDPGGPQTIVVLGSDRRFQDGAKTPVRADTVLLVRLDPDKGATAVMSLPRDLQVTIPGHGIDKINAAYAYGGPKLTVATVREYLAPYSPTGTFPIHHAVNINFGGFQRAVNRLGCVYMDVDRRYFNDNNPPFGGGGRYAVIDVPSGYQKLCGQDSLDFVRFRHLDSDLVRGARQQEYLRQAKDQIGVSKLLEDRKELFRIFGRYTQTDIKGSKAILRLIKLTIDSAQKPLQEVQFPGEVNGQYVVAGQAGLRRAVQRFLNAKGSPTTTRGSAPAQSDADRQTGSRKKRKLAPTANIVAARKEGEDVAIELAPKLSLPVYYPKVKLSGSFARPTHSRAYVLKDRQNHKYDSYRMVVQTRLIGQYYGVQGTEWMAPPILDNPTEEREIVGRKYLIYKDGSRIRMIAWKTRRGSYWVSNTLLQTVGNRQMLAIARSLSRIGT